MSREPSTLMTGRMGSQCDINCIYGDELDDGSDDRCDGVFVKGRPSLVAVFGPNRLWQ